MAKLPEPADPTLQAVDDAMELEQNSKPRAHLGASQIGDPCNRKLWYSFRWARWPLFYAGTLKLFDDGHRSESIMADRLRRLPELDLHTETPDGHQYRFSDHGGHFAGSVDGLVLGLLQAPKTPHIWEHKCVNDKKFALLNKLKLEKGEKQALAHWDAVYYAQAQVYMHYFQMDRHYLTCATPGTRDVTSVRTNYNADHALPLVQKAKDIIASDAMPTRITDRKDDHRCKFCTFLEVCHYDHEVAENCRTCKHGRPVNSGWHCGLHDQPLDYDAQYEGCENWWPIEGLRSLSGKEAA